MLGRDRHDNGGYYLFVGSAILLIVLGSGCGAEKMGTTGYKFVELLVQRIFPQFDFM